MEKDKSSPVIIVCHCCCEDNIYSHMVASQGDQEVVFMATRDGGLWVKVSVVCAAPFLDLCEGCNDIIFNGAKGNKLNVS